MAKRRKKSNVYWTAVTDVAIIAYNSIPDRPVTREKIYQRFIFPALMKLAENLINKMKPEYIDSTFLDLQTDLVTYLTERLNKLDRSSGKGYSYYTRTGWNYLIQENEKAWKKLKSASEEVNIDEQRNIMAEIHNNEMLENIRDFMDAYVEYCYDNLNYIFSSSHEIHVADSVLHFFEERVNIEDFNKKALFVLIRERAGLNPSQTPVITKVMKTLKRIYEDKFEEFKEQDFINLPF